MFTNKKYSKKIIKEAKYLDTLENGSAVTLTDDAYSNEAEMFFTAFNKERGKGSLTKNHKNIYLVRTTTGLEMAVTDN